MTTTLLFLASAAWACDLELLGVAKADLLGSSKSADVKFRKLAGSLGEACDFAPNLDKVMTTLTGAENSMRPNLEQKVIALEPAAWDAACIGGRAAFDAAFAATGPARDAAVYGPCNLARYHYLAPGELPTGTGVPFLAILVAKHFEQLGVDDETAIPMLRALSGLSGTAQPVVAKVDLVGSAKAAIAAVAGKRLEDLPVATWQQHASALMTLCEQLRARPTPERQGGRPIEVDTCAQGGRSADLASLGAPFVRPLNGQDVNWGYYLAAASAKAEPTLIEAQTDLELRGALGYALQQIESGALPMP